MGTHISKCGKIDVKFYNCLGHIQCMFLSESPEQCLEPDRDRPNLTTLAKYNARGEDDGVCRVG